MNASQVRTKRAAFSLALMSRQPHELHRLVGDDADRIALDPAEAGEDVRREQGLGLQEFTVVQHVLDRGVHVVRLVRGVRDQRVQLAVLVRDREVRLLGEGRGLGEVVRREVGEQRLDVLDGVLLVARHVVRHPGSGVVGAGAAQLLEADVLAGDRLDDVGPGDEHVRGLVDHDREVGDRGGVDRAARARSHDQRDLRDDTGGVHIAPEDLREEAQRRHAFLDTGAAAVVDADDRAAGLQREVHHLDDFLTVDLTERAAEDGEVLRVHADGAAVDRAVPGDDTVPVRPVLLDPEVRRAVPGEFVELDEGALVQQQVHALARRQLALRVLLLHRAGGPRVGRLLDAALQVRELARGGVDVGLFRLGHRVAAPCLVTGTTVLLISG